MPMLPCPVTLEDNESSCGFTAVPSKLLRHLRAKIHKEHPHIEKHISNLQKQQKQKTQRNIVEEAEIPHIDVTPESPLLDAWKTNVNERHPLFEEGIEIIREVLKKPIEEIPLLHSIGKSGTRMFMKPPQEVHIHKDLISEGGVYVDMKTNTIDTTIGFADLACSLIGQPEGQYINAIGIPASKDGLLSCQPIRMNVLEKWKPSYQFQEDNIKITSCYGPAGAITDAHIDSAVLGTIVSVWQGRKIWITWPPTKFNLEAFASKHFENNHRDLIAIINTLQEMKVRLLIPGDAFYMPAGTIHAVLTPVRSAISSVFVAIQDETPVVKSTLVWEMSLHSRWTPLMCQEWAEQTRNELAPWSQFKLSKADAPFFSNLWKKIGRE